MFPAELKRSYGKTNLVNVELNQCPGTQEINEEVNINYSNSQAILLPRMITLKHRMRRSRVLQSYNPSNSDRYKPCLGSPSPPPLLLRNSSDAVKIQKNQKVSNQNGPSGHSAFHSEIITIIQETQEGS